MKKLILLLLIGLSFNLNAQIGAYTSREIDSIVIQEGGALSVMVNKSQKRQKKWQKVNLDELVVEDDYIQEARQMKKDGKSFREIEKELNSKGYEVSKSSIQRRLD